MEISLSKAKLITNGHVMHPKAKAEITKNKGGKLLKMH